jgi:RHS repeat-associated protein
MRALQLLFVATSLLIVGDSFAVDLSSIAQYQRKPTAQSSRVTRHLENPIDRKLVIGVSNYCADVDRPLEIMIGKNKYLFPGAGTDSLGNYIPTNATAIVSVMPQREYPLTISCTNNGPEGSPLFMLNDFYDVDTFISLLTNVPTDSISTYLWTNFTSEGRVALTNLTSSYELKWTNLVQEMNRIVLGASIHDSTRFQGITLSSETLALNTNPPPTGHLLARLNRLLLVDAYYSLGTYYFSTGSYGDPCGTAEFNFSVMALPEFEIRTKKLPEVHTVQINGAEQQNLSLVKAPEGNVSTNYGTIKVLQHKNLRWAMADGSDDATKAPGTGKWLELKPFPAGETNLIGLEWSVSLGRLFDGLAAGIISFRQTELGRDSYTPYALYYNTASKTPLSQVEIVYARYGLSTNVAEDTVLRQIKSYQTFVDIVSTNTNSTVLKFYLPQQVATNKNELGIYTNFSGSPFVTWTIANAELTTTNKLVLFETRSGETVTNYLARSLTSGGATWTLTQGTGPEARVETRAVTFSGNPVNTRVELNTVRYANSATPSYQCQETYFAYPWGWELKETRIPDTSDLVTSYDYYSDQNESYGFYGFGQLKHIIYPDGYWEKRIYEDLGDFGYHNWFDHYPFDGLLRYVLHPSLQPGGTTDIEAASLLNTSFQKYYYPGYTGYGPLNCRFFGNFEGTTYDGDPASSLACMANEEGVADVDYWAPEGAATISSYTRGDDDTYAYGTDRYSYTDAAPPGLAGHPVHNYMLDGINPNLFYYYDHGVYTSTSGLFTIDSTNHLYTEYLTNRYSAHRETRVQLQCPLTVHGIMLEDFIPGLDSQWPVDYYDSLEGHPVVSHGIFGGSGLVPRKTIKLVSIFDKGSLAQEEQWIYSGRANDLPVWALLSTTRYYNDSLGRATNVTRIDPVSNQTRILMTRNYRASDGTDGELLRSETDEFGVTKTFVYDSLKRLKSSVTQGIGSQPDQTTTIAYDASFRVLTNRLSSGALTTSESWSFDRAGRERVYSDRSGIARRTDYSSDGLSTSNTFPGGVTRIEQRGVDRRARSIIGTALVPQFFEYDFNHRSTLVTTRLAAEGSPRWTREETDDFGFVGLRERPCSSLTTNTAWTWQTHQYYGYLTTKVGSYGIPTTEYSYDRMGLPIAEYVIPSWGTNSPRVKGSYQTLTQLEDSDIWYNATTNFIYLGEDNLASNVVGVVLEQLNGFQGNETARTLEYDVDGNLVVTTTLIDRGQKQVTTVTSAPNTSSLDAIAIVRNGLLQQASSLTASEPTRFYYDALGRTNRVQDTQGNSVRYTFDSSTGWTSSMTDPAGQTTYFEYYGTNEANAGKVKCQTSPSGKKTYFSYTSRGELYRTWGDVPYPAEYRYNQYGELTNLITFRGGTGWSGSSWPTASSGVADNTYWTYDEASGALLKKTDAQNRSVTYTYDTTTGQLLSRTWARLNGTNTVSVTNAYNGFGDLVQQEYSDGTPMVEYLEFNRAGVPQIIVDGAGTNVLTYDVAGRLVSSYYVSGLLAGVVVSNHFHPNFDRDSITVRAGSTQIATSYGYDDYGRLSSVASGAYRADYAYEPNSALLSSTTFKHNMSNVLTTKRTWDYGFRLSAIVNESNGDVVSSHGYQYDALNRRTRAALEDGSYWRYEYNNRDELVDARRYWPNQDVVGGQQFAYAYDNIGNRKTATEGLNWRQTGYAVNSLNQYTTVTNHSYQDIIGVAIATNSVLVNGTSADRKGEYFCAEISAANASGPLWQSVTVASGGSNSTGGLVVPAKTQSLSYDADGNLVGDGIWAYQWDAENRLKSMWMTNITALAATNRLRLDFAYDYMGRRVRKAVSAWNGSSTFTNRSTELFVYDLGSWNLLAVLNSPTTVVRGFLWGQDLSGTMQGAGGVGGFLGMLTISNAQVTSAHFPAYDGNGNVTALVDQSRAITARYEYSPFGETLRATGPTCVVNPFRFSTKFADDESGLVYYGYRYFSPTLGRWIGRDPLEEAGGNNLFAFCINNGGNQFDPLGCDPDWPDAGDVAATYATGGISLVSQVREAVTVYSDLNELAGAIIDQANPDEQIDMLIGLHQASGELLSDGLRKAVKPMTTVLGKWEPDMKSIIRDDKWLNEWKSLGHNILNLPGSTYTRQKNIQWLSSAIRRGDTIYMASSPFNKPKVNGALWDELRYLAYAGYERIGDYMVKTKSW